MGLSTHILDTSFGRPAANVALTLSRQTPNGWQEVGHGTTDVDGRCKTLLGDHSLEPAAYKLHFAITNYFAANKLTSLYPYVEIIFTVADPSQHYHIPLLLAANGYTTYRGS